MSDTPQRRRARTSRRPAGDQAAHAPFEADLSSDEAGSAEGPFIPAVAPPWELLPDDFKRELGFLQRWAATLDGAPKRCPRRDCRRAEICHAETGGIAFLCDGTPSERAGHWTTGMWLAHSLKLDALWP